MWTILFLLVFVAPVLIVAYYAWCRQVISDSAREAQKEDLQQANRKK